MNIIVNVTQEDIENGTRSACSGCPIAIALTRAVGSAFSEVSKDSCSTHFFPVQKREALYAYLPDSAQAFVQDFDRGLPVKPFTFGLLISTSWISVTAGV